MLKGKILQRSRILHVDFVLPLLLLLGGQIAVSAPVSQVEARQVHFPPALVDCHRPMEHHTSLFGMMVGLLLRSGKLLGIELTTAILLLL